MRITRRTKAMAFFIVLGVCLVGLAVALNVSWIIFHWRQVVPLVLGIILFGLLIAGMVINTIFLVREIRRNEQQDSFLNAITHELKTPIASIRLYLQTLESRPLDEAKRREFYHIAAKLERCGFCGSSAGCLGTGTCTATFIGRSHVFWQRTVGWHHGNGQR
jgi:signal transduction histidine kinase